MCARFWKLSELSTNIGHRRHTEYAGIVESMKSYTSIEIAQDFPDAKRILSYEIEEPDYQRKFISIFHRWLRNEDYHLLDCKDEDEREARNKRLLSHWELVFNRTPVVTIDKSGYVRQETDRETFLAKCGLDREKAATDFIFVLLPALHAYYKEDWDDTNIVWFSDANKVQLLFDWAEDCGLHVLEDWRDSPKER